MKTLYIDGGCSKNNQKNQKKRKMISVVTDNKGNVLIEKKFKQGSNNIAEFLALYFAIDYCFQNKIKKTLLITDSVNNLYWFKNKLKKKKQNNFELIVKIRKKIDILRKNVDVTLIRKSRNVNLAGIYIEKKYKR